MITRGAIIPDLTMLWRLCLSLNLLISALFVCATFDVLT
jgi:hypothetical protein